jgi:hypothetical protein
MHVAHAGVSEAAIYVRILEPEEATLDVAATRAILDLEFKHAENDRMRALLAKAKKRALTAEETVEIDNYERVGHVLSLMRSKATMSNRTAEASLCDRKGLPNR